VPWQLPVDKGLARCLPEPNEQKAAEALRDGRRATICGTRAFALIEQFERRLQKQQGTVVHLPLSQGGWQVDKDLFDSIDFVGFVITVHPQRP
jgi:hypothetical protein